MGIGQQAFWWGIASAVSLPLGALIGLLWRPSPMARSVMTAFGAGALLFALTIEMFGHIPHLVASHGMPVLVVSVVCAFTGGMLFDLLNLFLNRRGAFLRHLSHVRTRIERLRVLRTRRLVDCFRRLSILGELPPEQLAELVARARPGTFGDGEIIFRQGDPSTEMYILLSGHVRFGDKDADEKPLILGEYETFGGLSILRGAPRPATACAVGPVRVFRLDAHDVVEMLAQFPDLPERVRAMALRRIDSLPVVDRETRTAWKGEVAERLADTSSLVSEQDVRVEPSVSSAKGIAMAVWLGIAVDAIPESLVIGILARGTGGMSLSFVVGVFLANLPEAMVSAVSMKHCGMGAVRILTMWASICVVTGVGAWLGAQAFSGGPAGVDYALFVAGIEGLAAGAMLTMIAETMMPEAFHQGGAVVGMSTLAGFLVTLVVKVL